MSKSKSKSKKKPAFERDASVVVEFGSLEAVTWRTAGRSGAEVEERVDVGSPPPDWAEIWEVPGTGPRKKDRRVAPSGAHRRRSPARLIAIGSLLS
jgi:hypothetical protein